jgi:hypothetical protein
VAGQWAYQPGRQLERPAIVEATPPPPPKPGPWWPWLSVVSLPSSLTTCLNLPLCTRTSGDRGRDLPFEHFLPVPDWIWIWICICLCICLCLCLCICLINAAFTMGGFSFQALRDGGANLDYSISRSTFGRIFRLHGSGHVRSSSIPLSHALNIQLTRVMFRNKSARMPSSSPSCVPA